MENSLRRLQTDYIDLYYLHFTNPETSYIDSIGELIRLKEKGKIRSIGISNVNVEQLKEANQHDLTYCTIAVQYVRSCC